MAFPGYGDCTEVEPKWDLELYTGHLSLLNDSLHPDALTDSDHSINDIINGSGSYSDLAITEIGGDGLYTTSLTSINGYTGATKTNSVTGDKNKAERVRSIFVPKDDKESEEWFLKSWVIHYLSSYWHVVMK